MSEKASEERPIRLAVLGGTSTGKTSLVSRLTVNIVHEVHYPTRNQTNWLFGFVPSSILARAILDEQAHERLCLRSPSSQTLEPIFPSPQVSKNVLLSPLVFQASTDNFQSVRLHNKSHSRRSLSLDKSDSPLYQTFSNDIHSQTVPKSKADQLNVIEHFKLPLNYIPPTYAPIQIDIIDTPGFSPDNVVPFLEVSLFRNLGKSILHGLADEPRRPVSTTSLLVASGASELNGKVDGYILVYSAVPELNHIGGPPEYGDDVMNTDTEKVSDGGFELLKVIRNCILDAWTEFRNYEKRWEEGKEDDIYSLVYSLRHLWSKNSKEKSAKIEQLRSYNTKLKSIELDPSSPDSPPPCIIVCSHVNHELASPMLIEMGRQLATKWKYGFVGIDSMDDLNVDVAVSLLIKEISEKMKLLVSNSNGSSSSGNSSSIYNSHLMNDKKKDNNAGLNKNMLKKIIK
ncbi:BAQ_1a_G0056070.mRNA.1.CDS.1 [Saccharomyces cerevisiae]|nr:BAQ_1a_G0056070.mRNA.1.CDS.1 [Saccharomyces cerevisiae]CAI4859658.1 BAM_G0055890.mRNA.1.CDS.1 [Saccharomyces cerevisiae]CAI7386476.1 BAM_G0055890.mRNA.1.CDS.1 [Saccharomyces cerevisiae]CAI7388950.1 BAQ_1a_G0056070.mRNA.1.CDS.1 [Saccharomyces cerevisiae]